MDPALAARLARVILDNLERDYPHKPTHVIGGPDDLRPPRALSPLFGGCFDWHSAVHSHFALARMLRAMPDAPWAPEAGAALETRMSPAAIAGELAFLEAPARARFQLPYGMAWLLVLCGELAHHRVLGASVRPLEALAAARFADWLSRLPRPIRTGEHSQSAFAMSLARDWAEASGAITLARAIDRAAVAFYGEDTDAPLAYEPSAYDFLSPALSEADLMARVLPADQFDTWLDRFLPATDGLAPVATVDPSDGKLAHAGGLNLSRAWMLRRIARALPEGSPRIASLVACEREHASRTWNAIEGAPYAETHWLPTFVVFYRLHS